MEPPDPNAYRGWTYEQLLAEAKRARAEKALRWKDHPELGPLKDELGELGRSPGGIDGLSDESRARFDALMKQIDAYPFHDPWGKEAGAVLTAIYREVVRRGDGSAGQLAADLDIWVGYINLFSKVADPKRMENVKRAFEAAEANSTPEVIPQAQPRRSGRWPFRRGGRPSNT